MSTAQTRSANIVFTTPRPAVGEVDVRPVDPLADASISPEHAADQRRFERDRRWLNILSKSFHHEPNLFVATRGDAYAGHLPLCVVTSVLFGRYVISLPYVNTSGVHATDPAVAAALVSAGVELAAEKNVRFLELRHEEPVTHPLLNEAMCHKVHMRMPLPATPAELMASLKSKRRSQLKNGLQRGFRVEWGTLDKLDDFYRVFSRNMRDLGTPVYGKALFKNILKIQGESAELCCLYDGENPIAAALLLHESGTTEVPSASSLKQYNSTNANMAMYWHLLSRAIERGSTTFDFGRSTVDGPTYAFKKQWGAQPQPAIWQYHLRSGSIDIGRNDNQRYGLAIRLWQRLPLTIANGLGPHIVRGIP